MSQRLLVAYQLPLSKCVIAAILAATPLSIHAETIEAYVRPVGPNFVSPCPLTHWIFDPCTGVESLASVSSNVDLEVDPCEPVMLTGAWGWTIEDCWAFLVSDATTTTPICSPQPGLRAERTTAATYQWFWSAVPCVGSYDVVSFYDSIGTPPSMDEFRCALNDMASSAVSVSDPSPVPDVLLALLVRGQQGALATDHYGSSSSGEPRRPPLDCAIDLSEILVRPEICIRALRAGLTGYPNAACPAHRSRGAITQERRTPLTTGGALPGAGRRQRNDDTAGSRGCQAARE